MNDILPGRSSGLLGCLGLPVEILTVA